MYKLNKAVTGVKTKYLKMKQFYHRSGIYWLNEILSIRFCISKDTKLRTILQPKVTQENLIYSINKKKNFSPNLENPLYCFNLLQFVTSSSVTMKNKVKGNFETFVRDFCRIISGESVNSSVLKLMRICSEITALSVS